LALLVFLVTFLTVPCIGSSDRKIYVWLGVLWLVLTLSFELLFDHFVAGRPWRERVQVGNVQNIVVLFITALSPSVAARGRGIL